MFSCILNIKIFKYFLYGSSGKESACNAEHLGWEDTPGEGKGYPLQYSGLENSMDCIVHGVAKSWTQLSNFHFQESYEDPNFSTSLSNGQNFSLLENYRAVVLKAVNFLSLCCNCLGDLGQEPLFPWHLSVLIYRVEGLEPMALDIPLCSAFIHSVP